MKLIKAIFLLIKDYFSNKSNNLVIVTGTVHGNVNVASEDKDLNTNLAESDSVDTEKDDELSMTNLRRKPIRRVWW